MAGAVAVVGIVLAACSTAQDRYRQRLADTGKPAMHAVSQDRLREIMKTIRNYPPLQGNSAAHVVEQTLDDVRAVARDMAQSAGHISGIADSLGLSAEEKATFVKLAARLGNDSRELSRIPNGSSVEMVRGRIDRIEATCDACHGMFRAR